MKRRAVCCCESRQKAHTLACLRASFPHAAPRSTEDAAAVVGSLTAHPALQQVLLPQVDGQRCQLHLATLNIIIGASRAPHLQVGGSGAAVAACCLAIRPRASGPHQTAGLLASIARIGACTRAPHACMQVQAVGYSGIDNEWLQWLEAELEAEEKQGRQRLGRQRDAGPAPGGACQ